MLDVIVLIAMAVTAAAFAVGLILHSGIAQIPALIAAAALYMVMAASYLMVARPSRSAGSDRVDEFEAALEAIDKDLQRIDRVEDDVSRLDLLADRVERLDQAMSDSGVSDRAGEGTRVGQFTQEFEEVHAKIETVRADLEGEARTQRDKMANDLRVVEGLIKQLAADLAAASAEAPPVAREKETAVAAPALAAIEKIEPEAEEEGVEVAPEVETLTVLAIEEETIVVSEEEASIGFLGESARKEARRWSLPLRTTFPRPRISPISAIARCSKSSVRPSKPAASTFIYRRR